MDRGSLSEPENRLGVLNEPPCAEPHAGWCGGWRLDTSGYPIMCVFDTSALTQIHSQLRTLFANQVYAPLFGYPHYLKQ